MRKDPASTDYQDSVEDALDAEASALEAKIIGIIAERLGATDESVSKALSKASVDMREIERLLERGASDLSSAIDSIMAELAELNAAWAQPVYDAAGAVQTGAAAAVVYEAGKEAAKAVRAVCRTSAIGLANADGTGFRPLREAYRAVISEVASAMARGDLTGERAVRSAVARLCRGGVRVMFEGGRAMELSAAVRMHVMDSYRNAMSEARKVQGDEYGADGYEVSAHGLCAPDHIRYQGRQFTKREFERIQRSLDRPIAEGMNCRHIVFPVLLGFSDPAYTDKQLERIKELSESKVTYTAPNGAKRTVTRYEFSQEQRAMERSIRKARVAAYAAECSGVGTAEAERRVRELLRRYRTASKEAGVETRLERTRLYIPR